MTDKLDRVTQFLKLSKEISELEASLETKKREIEQNHTAAYASLKRELNGYVLKIKPTVDTVCNLYKQKLCLSGNKIGLQDGVPTLPYTSFNACEVALRCGNESIGFLSAVIKRSNLDVSLREFAIRYNTVVEIYETADELRDRAISSELSAYKNKIISLKKSRGAICQGENELNELIGQIIDTGDELRRRVIIENEMELEKNFVTEISLPIAYEADRVATSDGERDVILSLLEWKLHEDGIMVIRADGEDIDSAELSSLAVNTVTQFLFSYPSTNKQILLCDSCSTNIVTTFAGILKNENAALFFDKSNGSFVKNSDEEIRSSLSALNMIINERIMLIGQSHSASILEYNNKNQDNPQPIIFALLNGYPNKYENACDDIASILKNGKTAGVFCLITENIDEDEDAKYMRRRLPELEGLTSNTAEFNVVGGKGVLRRGGVEYLSDTSGENYSMNSILDTFKVEVERETNKVIYLDSVIEKEDFASSPRRKKYSKTLSIPFGKQGASPISIELKASDHIAHLAAIGSTGSGKTAFINTFVLSACKHYSPDELEVHLIVPDKGDFNIFKEEGLPHLKTVVTGSLAYAADDVFEFIEDELKRRGQLIGSQLNIYAYNEVAEKPLPRCMIVIDEFHKLVEKSSAAVERINTIANMGRAYGISLVISSIRFPMEVNSMIPQFGNRIEFKSGENAGQLIPQAERRQSELEGIRGSCFYAREGNIHSVRVAFSEEGERLRERIRDVKNQYPDHTMEIRNEINVQRIERESDVPFTVNNAKKNYDKGVIRTRLGRTYLTNKPLEQLFNPKNNLIFLFGNYLCTKMMEASLIKDVLVLSNDVDEPTVYYIDYNKNMSLRREKTVIKRMLDSWQMSGKMSYSNADGAEDAFEEIKGLIHTREEDEESELYPVLVMIAKADELFKADYLCEALCELISAGKETNVYFAIQCNDPVDFYGKEKYVQNAIIFPDCDNGDEESYSSAALCTALEALPAGETDRGKKLISNTAIKPLDPRLHLLCNDSKITIFVPYEYGEEYLKNIVD